MFLADRKGTVDPLWLTLLRCYQAAEIGPDPFEKEDYRRLAKVMEAKDLKSREDDLRNIRAGAFRPKGGRLFFQDNDEVREALPAWKAFLFNPSGARAVSRFLAQRAGLLYDQGLLVNKLENPGRMAEQALTL